MSEIIWTTPDRDWETTLTGEMLMCGLLAKVLLSIPERDWLNPLIKDEVFTETPFGARQMDFQEGQNDVNQKMNAQRDFLAEHLILWGPLWSSLMVEHARTSFYRGVALLTRGILHEMADSFELKIPEYRGI